MRLLIVDADLLALERIRSQAEKSGHEVHTTSSAGLGAALAEHAVEMIVIDLDRGGDAAIGALSRARAGVGIPEKVVGFYSHVAPERAEAAEAAGCRALPRGRFYRSLADLLGA